MAELPPGSLLLVACSGGADSLALAAGAAFEAPRLQLRAGGVTVDHGLQPGSASQAEHVGRQLAALGLDPVISTAVAVARDPGSGGPEAAARDARYQALRSAAARSGAAAVLLGHTLDDQAETVLLGLARGSGGRSLAGMAAVSGLWRRPMLGIPRDQAAAACAADRLQAWQDPHNSDPAFARVRVRTSLLPLMEQLLGPGVASALARTADQLRADADALDQIAALEAERMTAAGDLGADGRSVSIAALAALPAAVRTRLLKAAAGAAGCPPGALSARHVAAADALVTSWHGQGPADLPGGVRCERRYGRLSFAGPVPDIAEQAATAVVPVRTEDTGGRH